VRGILVLAVRLGTYVLTKFLYFHLKVVANEKQARKKFELLVFILYSRIGTEPIRVAQIIKNGRLSQLSHRDEIDALQPMAILIKIS